MTANLPEDFPLLQLEVRNEGYKFIDRFVEEWNVGTERFSKPAERLLLAFQGRRIAGIGGITHDPLHRDALRMRRFYVRPQARGLGIGRLLLHDLIAGLTLPQCVTVHAGTPDAEVFWDAMLFKRSDREGITHEKIFAS